MAKYRQVEIAFWQDPFVVQLTPEEKYFYLYLMTNSKTSACGIYEMSQRVMELETGYNAETVTKLLNRFIEYGKLRHAPQTQEFYIVNWIKYNAPKSPATAACVCAELNRVKHREFAMSYLATAELMGYPLEGAYRGPIGGRVGGSEQLLPPRGEPRTKNLEQEPEQETEPEPDVSGLQTDPVQVVFAYWQAKLKHTKAALTPERRKKIKVTLEHYSVADICKAIDGCAVTPHNMGENERGEVYDDLCLILRDASHIERFMRNADRPPKARAGPKGASLAEHNIEVGRRWAAKGGSDA